ncbi:MAG TPA: NUDIX domain-containing protein [Candidatus Dormibacteraeota bacterium]|nr:NUDIX domain-containing protein [Candidatus Dormibacteraeota bacterium]
MSGTAIPRAAARVLLLDPAARVLLVRFEDRETDYSWWATPGGGIQPDETPEGAARREVHEETGLRDFSLGPCVWIREFEFTWRDRRYRQREHIFAARVPVFEPSLDGFEGYELALLPEHRWWTVDEIERSRERFGPRRLGGLLRELLARGFPAEPIEIGV